MLEQDYIMRTIKEMIRAILKLIFQMNTESPIAELLESQQSQQVLEELLKMVDEGDINGAENKVTDLLEGEDDDSLKIGLLFYDYLNEKTDEFLEANGFSREEIKLGLEYLTVQSGLGSVTNMLLES